MKGLISFVLIFILLGCTNNQSKSITKITEVIKDSTKKENTSTTKLPNSKPLVIDTALTNYIKKIKIKLHYGFTIIGCSIIRNGERIYADTLDPLIYNHNDLYPILRDLGNNTFELLLQYQNAPNMDEVQHFIIQNNKVVKLDTLPSFFSKARSFGNDSLLEYAGVWDYGEVWGKNEDSTDIRPIYFYEIRKYGIVLDSILTIKTNKRIYGESFNVFHNKNWVCDYHKIGPKLEKAFDTLGASLGKKR